MKKICLTILTVFLLLAPLYAAGKKQSIDTAISIAGHDIVSRCSSSAIVVIDDFKTFSRNMTVYIREQLADAIYAQDGLVQIVTREHMDKVEKELQFQQSGVVSEKTIVSVAERLGAQAVIFGVLDELDNAYVLRIRMLDVKTGSYLFRKTYDIVRSPKTEQLIGRAAVYHKGAIGFTAEANKNSLDYIAPGAGVTFDYAVSRKCSLGIRAIASYDVYETDNTLIILEPLASLRFYLVSPSGEPVSGFFIEGLGGVSLLFTNSELTCVANGGGSVGYRFALGNAYIEPTVRGGYPYIFGAGITAGFRF